MTVCKRISSSPWARILLFCILVLGSILPALAANPPAGAGHSIFQWRPFLAPFHAVVLHFPIGFLTMAFILEIYGLRRPGIEIRRVTVLVLWLSLLTGVISAAFGILRGGTGGYETHALSVHRVFGLAVPGFTLATLVLQKLAFRHEAVRGWILGYRFLLTATITLVVIAGHLGGNLTHGSKYLVENAPKFVRDLVQDDPVPNTAVAAAVLDENQRLYTEKVQPIFAMKCYSCHGAEKQKSDYRLDQPELALKGGESGKVAIKPHDPMESHLVRLILLPPDHDDVMPPSGRQPLTNEEIMIIVDWIRNGAAFPGAPLTVANPGATSSGTHTSKEN